MRILSAFYFIFFLFSGFKAHSQFDQPQKNNFPQLKNYAVKNYTINNGLPSKSTTCIIKDSKGFLWVGTENGLCRFDGYTFKTFVNIPGDSTSLTNNYINVITEDKKGRIWIGTLDGLNLLDPLTEKVKRFTHQDQLPGSLSNNKVWSLLADQNNTIWIGTDDGFDRYNEKTGTFEVFQPNASNPDAIKGKSVNAIIEDHQHYLWLGNWGGGLNRFDQRSKKFLSFLQPQKSNDKNPNDVWSLSLDKDDNIWVGTYWKGLFKFNQNTRQFTRYPSPGAKSHGVFRMLNLDAQLMLIAADDGFYWFNAANNSWKQIDDLVSFQQAGLFQDKNGIIWICSRQGLTKLDRQQYKFTFLPFSTTKRVVKSILVKDNAVWVGTNDGLHVIGFNTQLQTSFVHSASPGSISSNVINKLYLDSRGRLWDLTEFGFDQYVDQSGQFIHHFHHSNLGSFFNEDVFRDILEVSPGEYWLATDAGLKIYHQRDNTFSHYFNQRGKPFTLSGNHLYCLAKDGSNNIWIGTEGEGVNRFDQATGKFYRYKANDSKRGKISNNDIHQIFVDSHKNIWICTQDGLNKYHKSTDSFQTYSKKNGFASNVFKQMVEDSRGMLWIVTETGLSCFNPVTQQIKNFDEGDGLFASAVIYKVNNHQLLLAGNSGLISFDPLAIHYNTEVPPVYISDLQIFNQSININPNGPLKGPVQNVKKIVLNYDQSVVSIEYVALNYTHTEKNRYAYKLDGFDQHWNDVGSQRKATYTNLSPGTYTFYVRASNNDGVWNKVGKTLIIVITPPWYLTWWAYLCYSLLLAAAVYGYVFYNNRQAKLKYEVKLAHMETETEKELHEKKLSFFTNISHEFRTPLTLILNPLKEILYAGGNDVDQQNLNTINRNARRLLSLVDQLLLFRKADADELKLSRINIVDLSREVFLCFSEQARSKKLAFDYFCTETDIEIIADSEKIEIVLFNLLSNAVKFTEAGGNIALRIDQSDDRVYLQVSDNGCGISSATGNKLYQKYYQERQQTNLPKGGLGIGLFLVKNYVEQHGGKISYESESGKGTVFTLEMLKGRAHLNPEVFIKDKPQRSVFFNELMEQEADHQLSAVAKVVKPDVRAVTTDFKSILVVEDNVEISDYLKTIFWEEFNVYTAENGESGLEMIADLMPDIIISDIMMPGISGIELCTRVKEDPFLSHIPVILLTAITSPEIKLKGIEGGADDYISKPFDKELMIARVKGILKSQNNLQRYFFNEITLQSSNLKISQEYKAFLEKCILIVELHLNDPSFTIKTLATEMGMSHSNVYRRIKSISGQSLNGFIRFVRLRKAAELFLNSDSTVAETAYQVGFNDLKYFREQFSKLFGLNPSDYIKKFRNTFHNDQTVSRDFAGRHKNHHAS